MPISFIRSLNKYSHTTNHRTALNEGRSHWHVSTMFSYAARLYVLIFPITFIVAILLKMGYDDLNDMTDPADTLQKSVGL